MILALCIAVVIFTFAIWLPNISLVVTIVTSDTLSWHEKLSFVWSLYGGISTNFSIVSATYTVVIALLTGVNLALLIYYVQKVKGSVRNMKDSSIASLGGIISGVFGVGCASCGTFIVASVLALFGAVGVLSILPFGGEEFGILGVLLLGYATYTIAKKIYTPFVCVST